MRVMASPAAREGLVVGPGLILDIIHLLRKMSQAGVAHTFNPSTWEAEAHGAL